MYNYLHLSASAVNMAAHTHTHTEDEALEHKVNTDQFIDEYCYYRSNGRHCVLQSCDCMIICRTLSSSTRQLQTLSFRKWTELNHSPCVWWQIVPRIQFACITQWIRKMLFIFREFLCSLGIWNAKAICMPECYIKGGCPSDDCIRIWNIELVIKKKKPTNVLNYTCKWGLNPFWFRLICLKMIIFFAKVTWCMWFLHTLNQYWT